MWTFRWYIDNHKYTLIILVTHVSDVFEFTVSSTSLTTGVVSLTIVPSAAPVPSFSPRTARYFGVINHHINYVYCAGLNVTYQGVEEASFYQQGLKKKCRTHTQKKKLRNPRWIALTLAYGVSSSLGVPIMRPPAGLHVKLANFVPDPFLQ